MAHSSEPVRALTAPGFHRLEKDAEKDEGDAKIEGEIDLAPFPEDEEGEDNRIAGLEVVSQVDGEGGEALQSLNLQEIHAYSTEERMTEHEPEITTFRDDYDRLLAWKEPEINGNDGRYDDESA